ncbi:hypothetical protein PRIPAC_76641 [Pristionchus pacificus]|uniref:Uncharacterized protein n=1 Tax=Pristionchus pacificus TaxID=54126 RepID=A0A2A6C731_PRIPA|nr:hypothetical protein PRIPAC_76641 [Pristionchus pacificus]|eukprot:PDM73927.1 hypothetical protein PRIPAC_41283 [Pristionchus pacificus]
MSSTSDIKISRDEYDLMHDLNMHSGLSFASSTYDIVHKDFDNDFADLFVPLVEEMKAACPSMTAPFSGLKKK